MALVYKATLPLKGLAIPLFGLFLAVGFELMLQISALLTLSLTLGISLVLPSIEIGLAVAINLILEFNLAISLGLPSFKFNLSVALSFELELVLGFIAILKGLLALGPVDLVAYGWLGPAVDFGGYVTSAIGGGWPDGTPSTTPITAFLFVATTRGAFTPDQVESLSLVAAPPVWVPPPPNPPPGQGYAPPVPTSPPPPAGVPYPPPQAYEAGLVGLSITAPPAGGTQARGVVTVDNSVSTGIGAVTGVTITDHGSGYTSAPTVSITDEVEIVSATSASPIVLTLPSPLSIPVGHGFGVTVSGVLGSVVILDAAPGVTDTAALFAAAQAAQVAATTPNTSGAQAAATAAAAAAGPITVTLADTGDIVTLSIPPGSYGLSGLNGTWFAKALSSTTAQLWADAGFTQPSQGSGVYVASSATGAPNVCGLQHAKVVTATTIALYQDQALTLPVAGVGTYTGGKVTGGGTGAAATCTMGGGAVNALQSFVTGIPWPTTEGLAGGVVQFSAMLGVVFDIMALLLGNLEARASLFAGISAGVQFLPPTVAASLQVLAKISANLAANLSAKLPSLSASASAALGLQINAIASLSASIGFFLGMGSVDLEIWQYTGDGAGLGSAIAAGPGAAGWHDGTPAGAEVVAGVFGLTTMPAQTAFGAFFSGATA
jgi:hypothetical protein